MKTLSSFLYTSFSLLIYVTIAIYFSLNIVHAFEQILPCETGSEIHFNKILDRQPLYAGQIISAKILLWNNTCFNINKIKEKTFVNSNIYISKIYSKTVSPNNSEVSILNVDIIFTSNIKTNSLMYITIGNKNIPIIRFKKEIIISHVKNKIQIFAKKIKYKKKRSKDFIIIFIFLFLFLFLLLFLIQRNKKRIFKNKKHKIKLRSKLKKAQNLEGYIALYHFKDEYKLLSSNSYRLFDYINSIQYRPRDTKSRTNNNNQKEIKMLLEYKNLVLKDLK